MNKFPDLASKKDYISEANIRKLAHAIYVGTNFQPNSAELHWKLAEEILEASWLRYQEVYKVFGEWMMKQTHPDKFPAWKVPSWVKELRNNSVTESCETLVRPEFTYEAAVE